MLIPRLRLFLLLVGLLLALPATTRAQTAASEARRAAAARQVAPASWVYITSAAADWSVSAVCVRVPCSAHAQTHPFVRLDDATAATAAGLTLDTAIVVGLQRWLGPEHPQIAQALLYALAAVRVIVLSHKVADLRRHATTTRRGP